MLDLLGNDFKLAILNMAKDLVKEIMSKDQRKSMWTIFHYLKNISKETEMINKKD